MNTKYKHLVARFLSLIAYSSLAFTTPQYAECASTYPDESLDLFGTIENPMVFSIILKPIHQFSLFMTSILNFPPSNTINMGELYPYWFYRSPYVVNLPLTYINFTISHATLFYLELSDNFFSIFQEGKVESVFRFYFWGGGGAYARWSIKSVHC